MAETPEDLYARIVEQVGAAGRLPMTPAVAWDVFPWEVVDGAIVPKVLAAPLAADNPREGDPGGKPCSVCAGDRDGATIWENDGWTLRPMPRAGLPLILMLEPKEHLDYTDLDDDQAAELGRLSLWTARIMSMRTIARSSSNRKSASDLASSVLPTPVGPRKMNDPLGRFGSFRPARVRRTLWLTALMAFSWPMIRLCSSPSMPVSRRSTNRRTPSDWHRLDRLRPA